MNHLVMGVYRWFIRMEDDTFMARAESVNVTFRSRLRRAPALWRQGLVAFAALCCCGPFAVQAQSGGALPLPSSSARVNAGQLPTLGDGSELAAAAERRLGDRIAREIYRDPDYLDDPILLDYLDRIWQPLLAAARARSEISPEIEQRFAWELLLGRDRTINAFALPGGYFGVHLGLIGVVSNRDELASVLAHEMSHVTQRHISRLISKQGEQTPWLIGAMILGVLAAGKNPEAANAVLTGGQAVAMQNQLNFSRDMEREADRVGFGVMAQAGFAPQGFTSMFDKLLLASRLNDNGAFPYLRSHPLTTERIADLQARQPPGPALALETTLEHMMVSARARVMANAGADALRQFLAEAADPALAAAPPARKAGALYGSVLASIRMRDFSGARAQLARLEALTQSTPAAQRLTNLLNAELALASGQPPPSLQALGRPELLMSAQILMGQGRAAEASQSLMAWVATHQRDSSAWQLLSAASSAQGQMLRAIRADAEARVAQMDYAGALERFKAGQTMVRNAGGAGVDHIEASIIDTRARVVQSLFREQSLER